MSDSESFQINMDSHDDDTVDVVLGGELDMADADWVEATLATVAAHHRHMNVDLSGLTFVDSTGIRTLMALKQRGVILGVEVHFTNPSPAVNRLLDAASLTGLIRERSSDQLDND